jgi:RNA binding exosome subunit
MTRLVRLELAVHSHATEDEGKVRKAILNLLPASLRQQLKLVREVLEGHYSNPIVRLTATLVGDEAVQALRHLASMLNEYEKKLLASTLEARYDERSGRLYLRLSKQEAYLGRARIYEGDDVVKITVVFQGTPSLSAVRDLLHRLGLIA